MRARRAFLDGAHYQPVADAVAAAVAAGLGIDGNAAAEQRSAEGSSKQTAAAQAGGQLQRAEAVGEAAVGAAVESVNAAADAMQHHGGGASCRPHAPDRPFHILDAGCGACL